MELPEPVVSYLQSNFLEETRPFCLLLDDRYRVVGSWGDNSWCGLKGVEPGADMRESAPFLVGLPLDVTQRFEFIETVGRAIVHAHLVPDHNNCYVVLLDARLEHAAQQTRQQSVNEHRLMHARQQKFIARQRELISELIETRSELEHHRRDAERSSAEKSRFIASMSHEFRTPLASIINYAELAAAADTSANDVQKCVETISRSARHLTSLVEALLDDARLDAGQLELIEHDFDLHSVFDDLAAMMAPLAAEKGLSFATLIEPDVPGVIHADEIRLRQVLINVLGNAVKFTVEGSVTIAATYAAGRLQITVADTGPGISSEDQDRVFGAFERGSTGETAGAGLGLTISLRLVQLMGGEVSLESVPGEGCQVTIVIPVAASAAPIALDADMLAAPGVDTMAQKPLSVLICDDDADMVVLVEHYLHRSGYGLIMSSDTDEAMEKTLKYSPDLVLMDCNVPGIGGVAAARELRKQGYEKPIVALTASSLDADEQSAFTEFFRKPAPMQELLAEIKRLTHQP
jgi:signal transduction histidine kinase